MRVDKYLWTVRLYKTRSLSTKECKQNNVIVNEELIKPSRELQINDEVTLKKGPIFYSYRVLAFPKSRVGAKLVADYVVDITPDEEIKKVEMIKEANKQARNKGLGRPTKKERRAINKFLDEEDEYFSEED
ncbi:MAG: RNA-binding S4 domain-containing protein [Flavobacteriales bacterium]